MGLFAPLCGVFSPSTTVKVVIHWARRQSALRQQSHRASGAACTSSQIPRIELRMTDNNAGALIPKNRSAERMADLLTIDELSDYLQTPKNTLYDWRQKGRGPLGHEVVKYVRYPKAEAIAWVRAQPTSAY